MKITEELIKGCCTKTIYKRGIEYFQEGRVHIRRRSEKLISAIVDGEQRYTVTVSFNKRGNISDYFCTCPYYETMGVVCKHIVAALEQCRYEGENSESAGSMNDKLAAALCAEYESGFAEKEITPLWFTLYLHNGLEGTISYSLAIETTDSAIYGVDKFLECINTRRECRLSANVKYVPSKTAFAPVVGEILDVLAESYENKTADRSYFPPDKSCTYFGSLTFKRLLPLLGIVGFKLRTELSGSTSPKIVPENPDILIDVTAVGNEIGLSVSDTGLALTPDGEWFLYEEDFYHTTPDWRERYMPIYNSLRAEQRTEFSFAGVNAMNFARFVLPRIRDMQGVVLHNVDTLVVSEKPIFKIYFDMRPDMSISAVVRAVYGDITFDLHTEYAPPPEKIVLRDTAAEKKITAYFTGFERTESGFMQYGDEDIYDFLHLALPELSELAEIYMSRSFELLNEPEEPEVTATATYSADEDLFELNFETNLSGQELRELLAAIERNEMYFRLKNGRYADLTAAAENKRLMMIADLEFNRRELNAQSKQLTGGQMLYAWAAAKDGDIQADGAFFTRIQEIMSAEPDIPEELQGVLRNYQTEGVRWMKQLASLGFGGILADDMGLGKTLQVISYIASEKPEKPTLVVAPASLVYNWMFEIQKFTPDESVLIIEGAKGARRELIASCTNYRYVITSYSLLRRDIDLYKDIEFFCCVIDEAQNIKNAYTMNAESVKTINAEVRFALTGTPIENSLTELWSIFDFADKGYLGKRESFRRRFEYPIMRANSKNTLELLKTKISPFVMRRMKSDVLSELPDKFEYTVTAEMSDEQKDIYTAYLYTARGRARDILTNAPSAKLDILTLLMRLRQICCHPKLVMPETKAESGKLTLLENLVTTGIAGGHRILIFSQFTSMLAIIRERMNQDGISCFYLDGSTPAPERVRYADRFNEGENDVFLISLKAGGTGLNLTGADMVIHYDPWWNPAVIDQASDRAYRIGQTRSVQVICLSTRGTIEEKMLKLHERKRALAEDVITPGGNLFSSLSNDEILALFE